MFGRRFSGDRRYNVIARAGYGNCERDYVICSIGDINLSVVIERKQNPYNGGWYDYKYTVALLDSTMFEIKGTEYSIDINLNRL